MVTVYLLGVLVVAVGGGLVAASPRLPFPVRNVAMWMAVFALVWPLTVAMLLVHRVRPVRGHRARWVA